MNKEIYAYPHQYRRVINLGERGEISFTIYPILPNGEDDEPIIHCPPIDWEEMSELDGSGNFDPRDPECIRLWLCNYWDSIPLSECTVLRANEDPEFDVF